VAASSGGTPTETKTIIISDAFSGADTADASAMTTDSALGGSPVAYQSTAVAGWKRVGGQLVRGTAVTSALMLPVTAANVELSVKVPALNSATGSQVCGFDVRRSELAAAAQSSYRCLMSGNGTIALAKVIAGATTVMGTSAVGAHVAGDVIKLKAFGSAISITVNGLPVTNCSVTDTSITSGNFAGVTVSSTVTSATYDDLTVSVVS